MKRRFFVFCLASLVACAGTGFAQEGGNPIKITTTLHGDGSRTDTQKDIDNHLIETKTYDASKKLVQRSVMKLDDDGLATEGILYNNKDVVVARMAYKYNAEGKAKEQTNFDPNGKLLGRMVFDYDAKGHVTVQAFDAQGNLIQGQSSKTPAPAKKGSRTGSR